MAKKQKKQAKKEPVNQLPENALPQNILPVGERVEENKNIYISQSVYKAIRKFTKNKTVTESGGILVGTVIEEFGKTNILISGFVEAKYCDATPTTLKFTHETWEYVHKEIEKKHKGSRIVGWIHTHPDFGIFLSEYDKFIHQNFFSEDYQVAYVVDPIQSIEGFYFWINGSIEKCKGFYIYDKTGVQITEGVRKEEAEAEQPAASLFSPKNILIAVLSVAVVFLIFSNLATNSKLKKLTEQQQTLTNSANQALSQMQQMLYLQSAQIDALQEALEEAGILPDSGSPIVPDIGDTGNAGQGTTDSTTDTTGSTTDTTEGDTAHE